MALEEVAISSRHCLALRLRLAMLLADIGLFWICVEEVGGGEFAKVSAPMTMHGHPFSVLSSTESAEGGR